MNAGGAIEVGVDYGVGSTSANELIDGVGATVLELPSRAEREGISTAEAALRSVDVRLARALAG